VGLEALALDGRRAAERKAEHHGKYLSGQA
jgi:hypothetical protein